MLKWVASKWCDRDGYVIMVQFPNGNTPNRKRMWWPMYDHDLAPETRHYGTPCWSREKAVNRYVQEVDNPNNRGLELALYKYSFNTCRGEMSPETTEIVFESKPCRYQ